LSVVSTTPSLPTDSATALLTVTFNRNLTASERNSFSATLGFKDSLSDFVSKGYDLTGGRVEQSNGSTTEQAGTYVITGNRLDIALNKETFLVSFVMT